MSSRKQKIREQVARTETAGAPVSAPPAEPVAAPVAPAPVDGAKILAEFDTALAGGAGGNAGKAAATFSAAEAAAAATPPEPAKRGPGRPRKSEIRLTPDQTANVKARTPGAAPSASGTVPPSFDRMTKAEVIAHAQGLQAQLGILQPAAGAVSAAEIAECTKTVAGLLELANLALAARNVPEFITSKDESAMLADAAAEPIAPYLRKLGAAQVWVRVGAVALIVYGPKFSAYMERVQAEKNGRPVDLRGKTGIDVAPAADVPPSAATLSGGFAT